MMPGELHRSLVQAHVGELHRQAAARRRPPPANRVVEREPVTLRFAFPDDAEAVARLATLDSAVPPPGPLLLAEVAGELRAALSLSSGASVADPFRPSVEVVELLQARASQLRGPRRARGVRPLRRIRRLVGARA